MLSILRNQRGQAAIFVALMFNVLFVFFAMCLNVAMVIHDKINLQNSVDLGVYYAAEKQAEILNAMAQQNYAIRQSWKLLVWRYRVLGTMGLDRGAENHPVRTGASSDTPYAQAVNPSFCVMYKPTWEEVPPRENLCNTANINIPKLPEVKVTAGFLGINHGIAALSRQLRMQFDNQCNKFGAYNWWMASSILHAFRLDQRNRKQVIFALAQSLAANRSDFVDLDGNSVLAGVRETITKNLTFANRELLGEIQIYNSLANIPPQNWLSEIKIAPTLLYTDIDASTEDCRASFRPIQSLPQRSEAEALLRAPYPSGLGGSDLIPWKDVNFLVDSDFQFSIGVEKNPWVMPYVGVKVQTLPRQIFFPTAGRLSVVARAFAKPFGGRMGPWYGSQWDRGALQSTGAEVDELLPPRISNGGITASPNDSRRLPNYSRYPGDRLGLSSNLGQNSMVGLKDLEASFDYYKNIKEEITSGGVNDIMAWNGTNNTAPTLRNFEMAIISPDLFDITYYSIEPNFTNNYWEKMVANRTRLGIPSNIVIRPDLGHNSNIVPDFNVQRQMELARSRQRSEAFFFVRDKSHLLTSWAPGEGTYNYDVEDGGKFLGQCKVSDDDLKVKNPGSCVAGGGRTGYSVKLVSRNFLRSNEIPAGGPNTSPNAIMNPPPDDF